MPRVRDFFKITMTKGSGCNLHNLTWMKIKEKIAIYNIILVLKQYELKVDINFKISSFPLTLTLTSLKNGHFNVNLDLNDYQRVQ